LNLLKQQLTYSTGGPNAFPGIEVVNTLVSDAIKSLQNGNTNDALMHLNLVNRQLRNGMITTTKTQTTPIQQPTIAPTQGSPKTKSNTVGTTVSGKSPTPSSTPSLSPRTFSLDPSLLVSTKQQIVKNNNNGNNNNPILQDSLRRLFLEANSYLTKNPVFVTEKTQLPASGDKHDFLSLAPYHWPDPTKPNGLPYIIRDGIINPEVYSIPDRQNLDHTIYWVKTLSAAYYFSNNSQYASKAAELLRSWFLNNDTRMNPNLQYAETVPGKNNGSSTGVIAGHNLPDVIDAIGLIQHSPFWTKQDQRGMELWFSKHLNWLLNSDAGKKESQAINNHGTWYDVQASSIALFLNKTDVAKNILQSSLHKLIAHQIQPDGRQPFELRRTNSWDYSLFNLQGLFRLASIGHHVGIDIWNYKTSPAQGEVRGTARLQAALDYLIPYAITKSQTIPWPYRQIAPIDTKGLVDLLCQASIHYPTNNQSYIQAYKSLNTNSEIDTNIENLLCSSHLS
jgi:hypothetical protein